MDFSMIETGLLSLLLTAAVLVLNRAGWTGKEKLA